MRIELTKAELTYTIGALEMTLERTTEFLNESRAKGMPTDVTEFAISIYQDALNKLKGVQ